MRKRVVKDLGEAVYRVSASAAYVPVRKTKKHPDPERAAAGETSTVLRAISARAAVYREEA